jgi:hypothetical protein
MNWSSLPCRRSPISPISSRKSVPPSASSTNPRFMVRASVNAPFSWPKSSDSMTLSASAEHVTLMNGPSARALA